MFYVVEVCNEKYQNTYVEPEKIYVQYKHTRIFKYVCNFPSISLFIHAHVFVFLFIVLECIQRAILPSRCGNQTNAFVYIFANITPCTIIGTTCFLHKNSTGGGGQMPILRSLLLLSTKCIPFT